MTAATTGTVSRSGTASKPIRLLVVEDNTLMRMGIVAMLRTQPDILIVGEASDGAGALARFAELAPDVLLLDLRMPVMDGVQVITAIRTRAPEAKILVLTHYDAEEHIFKAVKAGANGYITKEFESEHILEAIRTVHKGGRYLPAEIAGRLADRLAQDSLSAREQEVLERIFAGLSNREISEALSLSEKTTAFYVSKILDKLGAKSRTEAVAVALHRGLISRV